jgi:NAD(P)-dependent dehydrogenase (short-subunit alcohol dehydrogenase family)
MQDLQGKTAVVTGGGAGIGRNICTVFADAGMNVVVVDLEKDRAEEAAEELKAKNVRTLALSVDVSDAQAVEAMADAVYSEFGVCNVLCNNAGVVQYGPVAEAPQEHWDWLFKVNLWGVVNGIRTFVPRMKAQGEPGHIVNTASLSGTFAVPSLGVYTASKYAVMGITETLRMELKNTNIGVSVLCPGPTPSRIGETAKTTIAEGDPMFDTSDEDADLAYLGWREPSVVAERVLDGIKADRLYIFSHNPGQIAVKKRFDQMLEDFKVAP